MISRVIWASPRFFRRLSRSRSTHCVKRLNVTECRCQASPHFKMNSENLIYTVADGVATVTLNRPHVMNALDAHIIERLRAVCESARDDAKVRVIVLGGNGPAFMAGGDVALFHANLPQLPALVEKLARELHHAIEALRDASKPVLASVHGAVAGAGVSLLAAADLAVASADAKFTLAYSKIGTSPDGGSTYFLPRMV